MALLRKNQPRDSTSGVDETFSATIAVFEQGRNVAYFGPFSSTGEASDFCVKMQNEFGGRDPVAQENLITLTDNLINPKVALFKAKQLRKLRSQFEAQAAYTEGE